MVVFGQDATRTLADCDQESVGHLVGAIGKQPTTVVWVLLNSKGVKSADQVITVMTEARDLVRANASGNPPTIQFAADSEKLRSQYIETDWSRIIAWIESTPRPPVRSTPALEIAIEKRSR